jgi:hypothetical protein
MVVVLMMEAKLVVVMDDLDFKVKDVTFEAKVLNRYGTIELQIRTWKIQIMHIRIMICWTRQL